MAPARTLAATLPAPGRPVGIRPPERASPRTCTIEAPEGGLLPLMDKLYSINQVADASGMSPQGVRKRLQTLGLYDDLPRVGARGTIMVPPDVAVRMLEDYQEPSDGMVEALEAMTPAADASQTRRRPQRPLRQCPSHVVDPPAPAPQPQPGASDGQPVDCDAPMAGEWSEVSSSSYQHLNDTDDNAPVADLNDAFQYPLVDAGGSSLPPLSSTTDATVDNHLGTTGDNRPDAGPGTGEAPEDPDRFPGGQVADPLAEAVKALSSQVGSKDEQIVRMSGTIEALTVMLKEKDRQLEEARREADRRMDESLQMLSTNVESLNRALQTTQLAQATAAYSISAGGKEGIVAVGAVDAGSAPEKIVLKTAQEGGGEHETLYVEADGEPAPISMEEAVAAIAEHLRSEGRTGWSDRRKVMREIKERLG